MRKKKVVSLLLCMTMLAGITQCVQAKDTNDEVTTVSFSYGGAASVAAYDCPRLADYLEEELGIKMDIWVNTDGSTEVANMLAGGEYSDIFIWGSQQNFQIAIDGGNVVNLMDYQDQLPSVFENEEYAGAIQYLKDTYGDGEALYALPMRVGAQESVYAFSPSLRFDVYQEIGAPEITDWDNFLDVLEEMQNAYPETEDGQKVYALSMAGTDVSTWWYNVVEPRGIHDKTKLVLASYDLNEIKSIFAEDSEVLAGLQWLFDANQRGLLDPDGMTQTNEDYQAKVSSGRILYVPFEWWGATNYNTEERTNAEDPTGYAQVWPECFILPASSDNLCGNVRTVAVSTKCENIEAALKYLNWLYSSEGQDIYHNDFEGYLYTVDENGNRVPTEAFYTGAAHEDGSQQIDLQIILGSDPTITQESINPDTGLYYGNLLQDAFLDTSNETNLKKEWIEWNDGYSVNYDKYKDTKQLVQLDAGFNLIPAVSDDVATMYSSILGILKETAVKMVYAENQEEFDALWEAFEEDAYALGYEEMFGAYEDMYAQAKEKADYYTSLIENS